MFMFIDTHCHLEMVAGLPIGARLDEPHLNRIGTILKEAGAQQVNRIITVGTNAVTSMDCIVMAQRFDHVAAAIGIHPCDVNDGWRIDFDQIKKLAQHARENKVIALGETGLDYYHKPFDKELQIKSFKAHLDLAVTTGLPLTLHVRESADDAMAILESYKGKIRAAMHCFQQSLEVAKTVIDWGFYLGISGTVTYPKNESLRQIVKEVSLDHLILETDAPFLPPQPHRGKPNHPAYMPLIVDEVARVLKMSAAEVGQITTANANALFSFAKIGR
jgi:TatD DNase family protein